MAKITIEKIETLVKRGKYKSIEKVLLDNEADIQIRKYAAKAIGLSGDKKFTPALIKALKDKKSSIRIAAANGLGELQDEDAVPPLIFALKDEYELVAVAAINAFVRIGYKPIAPVLVKLLSSSDLIQEAALEALGKLGTKDQITDIMLALGNSRSHNRLSAANALYELGETKWKDIVKGDDDDYHRLAMTGDYRLIYAFTIPLGDSQGDTSKIEAALYEIKCDNKVDILLGFIDTDNVYLKEHIIKALGSSGDKKAVEPLAKIYKNSDEDKLTRDKALEALGEIGDESTIDCFKTAASSENYWERETAAEALGKFKCREAVSILTSLLNDKELSVIMKCANSLGEIGDECAVKPLLDALGGEDKIKEAQDRGVDGLRDMQGRANLSILDALKKLGYK